MIDIEKNEESILDYWKRDKTGPKLKDRNSSGKKFFFLDGPPYATGDLAGHHVWVGTIKDVVLRYKRYRKYNVHDRAGFDVHGLPIENKVEKLLDIKNKNDIENIIGIEKFVEECKKYADKQVSIAVRILKEFGSSLDFDSMYIPYTNEYMERGWGVLKEMHSKKLLYKGENVLAYCPHCETVLSAQGPEIEYEDVNDKSIFVEFKLVKGQKSEIEISDNTYLVIWTTTPWTLVSNMAIAVNPDAAYVVAEFGSKRYVIAKDRLEEFSDYVKKDAVILAEIYGSEMKGLKYESPLSEKVPMQKSFSKYHKVVTSSDFVTISEGTGLLHVAPAHGPDDFKLCKANRIPVFSPVDDHARYTGEAGDYAGLSVPDEANSRIMKDLEEIGSLVYTKNIKHSYPHCWRCGSKLVYKATTQWFINVQKLKKKMIKEVNKTVWHPDKALEWMRETIEESPDWCISRQRYWGCPIPIWECGKCHNIEVIGSRKELSEKSIKNPDLSDIHRPFVDDVEIRCQKCGGASKRIKDVFDVWYDSGISHTASLSQDEFKTMYPADWISESRDQLRGWFSVLLRTAVALYGNAPFKEVTIGGMIFDELGREMHRHLGNSIYADEIRKIGGSDGFRIWCASRPRWQDLKLKKKELLEGTNNVITLYNISELLDELSQMCGFDTKSFKKPSASSMSIEDTWIMSRLNSVVKDVTDDMDRYGIDAAVREMRQFLIEDFSRVYLKFLKKRTESASVKQASRIANTLAYLLHETIVMMSIVIPFSSEHIYQKLFSRDGSSIFMADWPKSSKRMIDKELEGQFEIMDATSTAILNIRERENIKLRQPLSSATVEVGSDESMIAIERLSTLIESTANIKGLKLEKTNRLVKEIKPLFQKLGPVFKNNAQVVGDELSKSDPAEVLHDIDEHGVYRLHTSAGTFDIKDEYFSVEEKPMAKDALGFKYGVAALDTDITEELKEESIARELIRNIQKARKDMGLTRTTSIDLSIKAYAPMEEIVSKNKKLIKDIVKARRIRISEPAEGSTVSTFKISGAEVKIGISLKETT